MRRLIEDVDGEGLEGLIGQRITLFCRNYIYTGKLVGVNDTCVKLSGVAVVYETGPWCDAKWKDAQALPHDWYVQTSAIESYGKLKE
jgi:hypothetical protein